MSAKPIHESKAKELLFKYVKLANLSRSSSVVIDSETNWQELEEKNAWLTSQKLVVKPDQLIKRRGKLGLIKTNASLNDVKSWIAERIGVEIAVGNAHGKLKRFLVERHVDHEEKDEYYVCILSHRDGDTIMFHHEGGINVGDVDAKARTLNLSVDQKPSQEALLALVVDVPEVRKSIVSNFITELYTLYVDLHFTYLEINPLVVTDSQLFVLDVAARIDQCADYLCGSKWGEIEWPAPFGREQLPEEAYIAKLDAGGASLKLTVLNKAGRVWTMVAGGGASVIYADTICDLGFAHELANYGEYSGAPSEQQTYEYAQTVLSLMTQTSHPDGKVLLIGGGIANFTNIATTFKGIIRALQNFKGKLIEHKVSIFVRRAGPNYQEGLRMMRDCGETLGVPVHVFGPETHMTAIVAMALGKREIPRVPPPAISTTANFLLGGAPPTAHADPRRSNSDTGTAKSAVAAAGVTHGEVELPFGSELFSANTKVVIWGMQSRAAQLMFDFDYVCRRKEPSLVAMTYPFVEDHKQKFYWGHKEIMIPVHKLLADCLAKHADATVLINFASHRSAFDISMEVLNKHPQIRVLVIIAEGIPENLTRRMNKLAREKGVAIIGPATVGAIKPGCLKVANTGGMMDNVLASKLYRPGSVAYVSRSGGMSNELNNIMAMHTDGVFEGVAIGGDRYPATTFLDHVLRYQAEDQVKLIVMLGEVGGVEEYSLIEARRTGKLTKPVVAWCTGTCAPKLTSDVQFGHAGAFAAGDRETAFAKNEAMRAAGFHVPNSFDSLGDLIGEVYAALVRDGTIVPRPELPPPTVPMDFDWARELGLIRKPASFLTSICDERGQELSYGGMPISQVIEQDMGIGGVLSLLWFQRRLPAYACKYIELCLMVTADHGPAVSGAHNTIVCARAGKDVVSCLTSGLLTIGDRFGGALDGAARQFSTAFDKGQSPADFIAELRKKGELIMGIGHRVKSVYNPDKRVEILKKYALENFPQTPLLHYALEVEKLTVQKRANLILNVDGVIGVAMVDLFRQCGSFTREECNEYIEMGVLNAMFVLGRSIGFIGHFLDQRRLKQGLYRHPWDDIAYVMPEMSSGGK